MGLALDIFGSAALASAATAAALVWFTHRILPSGDRSRGVLPAAVAAGYCAGYLLLPRSWATLVPNLRDQPWAWLPYLGLAAAAVRAVPSQGSLRWAGIAGMAIVAGCVLTPNWPIFGLLHPISVVVAVVYLLLIAAPMELLPSRQLGQAFVGWLALAASLLAVAVGVTVSIRFAQLAALAAAALAGCWAMGFLGMRSAERSARSLVPVFVVLVGGIAFIGCVEPEPPVVHLLVLPLTPLVSWLWLHRRPQDSNGDAIRDA